MTRPSGYYPPGHDFSRVTLTQVAREIGRSPHRTKKLLNKLGFIGFGQEGTTYDAHSIEVLKAFMRQPHRHTNQGQTDWLSDYIGGSHHG